MTTVPSSQQSVEAFRLATPKKLAGRVVDKVMSPLSETKSPGQQEDEFAVEDAWDHLKSTAVQPANLPAGAEVVLVTVPLNIDAEQLEGAQIVFPSDSLATGRLGNTVEVSTVQNGADTGVHVLGINDGVASAAKVAAVYSLQYPLPEPAVEEEAVDFDALEALRAEVRELQEPAPDAQKKKKKKKKKRQSEEGDKESPADPASVDTVPQQHTEQCEKAPVSAALKTDKEKKSKKEKKRKHAAAQLKSHPVDPIDPPSDSTPVKKKNRKALSVENSADLE